ncbi:MAG: AAA family ATPase [Candidatus Sumerlaeia bacterium]|nr:AAA family ATPase [Candidatus Sumerlaeia bacterium]
MYLKRLKLENIKCLREAGFDFTTSAHPNGGPGWFVLAGGNGTGKTTVLQVAAFFYFNTSKYSTAWKMDFTPVKAGDLGHASAVFAKHSGQSRDAEAEISYSWQRDDDGICSIHGNVTKPERTEAMVAGYGSHRRLRGAALSLRDDLEAGTPGVSVISLFQEDAGLDHLAEWIVRVGLKDDAHELRDAVIDLLDSELYQGAIECASRFDEDGRLLFRDRDGREFPLTQCSDGVRSVTGIVLDLLLNMQRVHKTLRIENGIVQHPGVVLIDEPDNHLHPEWQMQVGHWFKKHFPQVQFIVATHSPFVCQAADKIWRLDNEAGEIAPRELSAEQMEAIQTGTIATVLESDAFRIFNTMPSPVRRDYQEYRQLREKKVLGASMTAEEQGQYERLAAQFPAPSVKADADFDRLFSS